MTQLAYTVAQAAAETGVSARTIDRATKATEAEALDVPLLPSKWVGKRRVIRHADLEKWLDQLRDA